MIAAWLFIRQYWQFIAGLALTAAFAVSLSIAHHGGFVDGQEKERAIWRIKWAEGEKAASELSRIQSEKNAAALAVYASAAIAREKYWGSLVGELKDDLKSPVYADCRITEHGWLLHQSAVTGSSGATKDDSTTMRTPEPSN